MTRVEQVVIQEVLEQDIENLQRKVREGGYTKAIEAMISWNALVLKAVKAADILSE